MEFCCRRSSPASRNSGHNLTHQIYTLYALSTSSCPPPPSSWFNAGTLAQHSPLDGGPSPCVARRLHHADPGRQAQARLLGTRHLSRDRDCGRVRLARVRRQPWLAVTTIAFALVWTFPVLGHRGIGMCSHVICRIRPRLAARRMRLHVRPGIFAARNSQVADLVRCACRLSVGAPPRRWPAITPMPR